MRQLPFVDADHEIERILGCTIREFFDREGEGAFRDLEQRVVADLMAGVEPVVVATGGGVVLRPDNREALRRGSTVIYLRTLPDDLARRLARDTQRPLLQVADPRQRLRDLFAHRDPLYSETAHLTVETAHRSAATLVNLLSMQLDLTSSGPGDVQ